MTHTTQVLSDEQRMQLWNEACKPERPTAEMVCDFARAIESATLKAVSGQEPVHQFRKQHCADWYDGHPDHEDGGGPYETRTLYTLPPAQPAPVDERVAFERYMTDNGKWPHAVQRYDNEPKGYVLLQTANAWEVWQARAALQCAQAPQPTSEEQDQVAAVRGV